MIRELDAELPVSRSISRDNIGVCAILADTLSGAWYQSHKRSHGKDESVEGGGGVRLAREGVEDLAGCHKLARVIYGSN